MKLLLSLVAGACLLAATAHAQSTEPAIGAKNNKIGVAKTDASLNPRKEPNPQRMKAGRKETRKMTRQNKMKMEANNPNKM